MPLKFKDVNQVKKEIELKGYSERGFAKKIKGSPAHLGRILREERLPSPPYAKKIADGLGEKLQDIFFCS